MYHLKILPELGWAVLIAVGTLIFQVIVDFDAAKIEDWETWAISLGSGAVRVGAAAALVAIGRGVLERN